MYFLTPAFLLSSLAFTVFIFAGLYFIRLWFVTNRRFFFLLMWGFGLLLAILFKLPNILVNAGVGVVQENLYPFFFLTLLVYFLAHILLIEGFLPFRAFSHQRLFVCLLIIGLLACGVYYAASFLGVLGGMKYAPIWLGHLLFFIPIQLILLFRVWRVSQWIGRSPAISPQGLLCVALGVFVLVLVSVAYILTLTGVAVPSHWYFSVISSTTVSVLQIFAGGLLFAGFRTIARSYIASQR